MYCTGDIIHRYGCPIKDHSHGSCPYGSYPWDDFSWDDCLQGAFLRGWFLSTHQLLDLYQIINWDLLLEMQTFYVECFGSEQKE